MLPRFSGKETQHGLASQMLGREGTELNCAMSQSQGAGEVTEAPGLQNEELCPCPEWVPGLSTRPHGDKGLWSPSSGSTYTLFYAAMDTYHSVFLFFSCLLCEGKDQWASPIWELLRPFVMICKKKKPQNEPMNKTKKSTKTQTLRVIYAYPQVDFKSY